MHGVNLLVPVLVSVAASIYFLADFYIERLDSVRVDLPHESASLPLLLSKLEGFEFDGTWRQQEAGAAAAPAILSERSGPSRLHVALEKLDALGSADLLGLPLGAEPQYYFYFRFSAAASPAEHLYYVAAIGQSKLQTRVTLDKKISIRQAGGERLDCPARVSLHIDDGLLRRTRRLKDLRVEFRLTAERRCGVDIAASYAFDERQGHRQMLKFIVLSLLVAAFDLALILAANYQFERFEHICRTESVGFWTTLAMFNCLFCFIQIFYSTESARNINFFFAAALAQFANFSFVILRILHRIGKVHIAALTGAADSALARRYIAVFYFKVYAIILFGLAEGVPLLQTDFFLYLAGGLFLGVVAGVARDNKRLFHSRLPHFALVGSKLLFVAYLKATAAQFRRADPAALLGCLGCFAASGLLYRLQREHGPRLFLARFWGRRDAFDYFRGEAAEKEAVCAICYSELEEQVTLDESAQLSDMSPALHEFASRRGKNLMATPCRHVFHSSCLLTFMHYKMSCPVCRAELPEIE